MDKETIYRNILAKIKGMTANGAEEDGTVRERNVREETARDGTAAELLQRTSELLQESLGFWWTGFYLVEDRLDDWAALDTRVAPNSIKTESEASGSPIGAEPTTSSLKEPTTSSLKGLTTSSQKEHTASSLKGPWLTLGPSVGPPACEKIRYGRGVCGKAWADGKTLIVPDVELFPGHIACSSESRSEIVVPVFLDGKVAGVLDVDSRRPGDFDGTDAFWLEKIAAVISTVLER